MKSLSTSETLAYVVVLDGMGSPLPNEVKECFSVRDSQLAGVTGRTEGAIVDSPACQTYSILVRRRSAYRLA